MEVYDEDSDEDFDDNDVGFVVATSSESFYKEKMNEMEVRILRIDYCCLRLIL